MLAYLVAHGCIGNDCHENSENDNGPTRRDLALFECPGVCPHAFTLGRQLVWDCMPQDSSCLHGRLRVPKDEGQQRRFEATWKVARTAAIAMQMAANNGVLYTPEPIGQLLVWRDIWHARNACSTNNTN